MLLWTGREMADLDAIAPRGTSLLEFFLRLAPAMMFLRSSSDGAFWHNDAPAACLVIDDPLLRRRYGFLDFEKLLELMERRQFCTSIAFIPWNFKRSDRRLARLFTTHPDRYSLSVHGCDHTRGEFGSSDELWLRHKAQLALDRMIVHRKLTGVDFDDVMVFPQCKYSIAAMRALKACGYLAVANSSEFPIDVGEGLALRDLLGVAVTRFAGLPLFIRRSARNIAELAFDLFLGKPALLVEHHGFFRNGYGELAETVEKVAGLDERLQWANLGTVCTRVCLKRAVANGDVEVRFFTDRFSLRNESARPQQYALLRRTMPGEEVLAMTCNGVRRDSWREADSIKARLSLGAGEVADIKVERGPLQRVTIPVNYDRGYRTKVFIRRSLSEFRDNYLDRSRLLSQSTRRRPAKRSRAALSTAR
jgi:hypothetical protein